MSAVVREEGGHQRIGDGFQRPVGKREDEHAPEEHRISVARAGRAEGDKGRKHVAKQRYKDQFAIADFIDDDPANHDAEAEAGETSAADGSELGAGETKFFGPVIKNAATEGETHAGREDGHKTGPK